MSYPVVTRLGINQFWYKHWYSDVIYDLNHKNDLSFEFILNIYLNYGLLHTKNNLFTHEYWYRKCYSRLKVHKRLVLKNNLKLYFRKYFYTNSTLAIEHSYFIRLTTPEYFPMRIWAFKYLNWVIFSVHWYKPLKYSKTKLRIKNNSHLNTPKAVAVHYLTKTKISSIILIRLKLLILHLTFSSKTSRLVYSF